MGSADDVDRAANTVSVRKGIQLQVNVKKICAVVVLGSMVGLSAACNASGEATPTRTPRAGAENSNPTQTPWIIYLPITSTPDPFTVTPLPTVTSSSLKPTPKLTNTREPVTPGTVATKAPSATPRPTLVSIAQPTPIPATPVPLPTQAPSCGQTYQVTNLYFPPNGDTRDVKNSPGAAHTIQFKWTPPAALGTTQASTQIGYEVDITGAGNRGAQLFISHNGYLAVQSGNGVVLSQQASYGLTNGEDTAARWSVTVVMSSAGFNDNDSEQRPAGTITRCGPASPQFLVNLRIIE